jgi:sigma-E factor negative regulatory protein RseB
MIRLFLILLFFSNLLQAQTDSADANAESVTSQELINRMSDATKKLNYEGEFVFTRGEQMDVMHMVHKSDDSGEREKIVSLTGPAREIIRNNQTVTSIFPDTQEVMVERSHAQSFATKLPVSLEAVADNYEFSTIGNERIAGRDSWVVSVTPKDTFRYGYHLWIDKETYLLLKSELRDEAGVPLEVVMFTELQLRDTFSDDVFSPSISGKEYTWYEFAGDSTVAAADVTITDSKWQVTWLPSGFRLSNHNGHVPGEQDGFLEHMIYSDGVSMVSIFIEKRDSGPDVNSGALKIGGVNVYARIAGDYQVTAVGAVPQATVIRMVDSVTTGQ